MKSNIQMRHKNKISSSRGVGCVKGSLETKKKLLEKIGCVVLFMTTRDFPNRIVDVDGNGNQIFISNRH